MIGGIDVTATADVAEVAAPSRGTDIMMRIIVARRISDAVDVLERAQIEVRITDALNVVLGTKMKLVNGGRDMKHRNACRVKIASELHMIGDAIIDEMSLGKTTGEGKKIEVVAIGEWILRESVCTVCGRCLTHTHDYVASVY